MPNMRECTVIRFDTVLGITMTFDANDRLIDQKCIDWTNLGPTDFGRRIFHHEDNDR